MKHILTIKNITVSHKNKQILDHVSCDFQAGKTYAMMGPNGSGKSTLVKAIAGVLDEGMTMSGTITLCGKSIEKLEPSKRSRRGIFLSYQSPMAIPGVSVIDILRASFEGKKEKQTRKKNFRTPIASHLATYTSLADLTHRIRQYADKLGIKEELLTRGIHDGFSGGERKKIEILQALILRPKFAFFDEIDTGLDVDALRIMGNSMQILQNQGTVIIIITHSKRILSYLKPDEIYIFLNGKIVASGDSRLSGQIEKKGYEQFTGKS